MRILHISTRLILGGSQENTILSCEGQARLGHEVHLAFGPIFGPEGSMLERVERFATPDAARITTHQVPRLVREVHPIKDWHATRQLRALIRTLRPDIVHTHSSKAGILGRAAAWHENERLDHPQRAGIVHTIHGPPFMPLEGGRARRAKVRAVNLLYELAERRAARHCHAIVAVANAMTRQFLARGIGQSQQYTTVYSGMETAAFLEPAPGETRAEVRRTLGLAPGDVVVGTVARLAQHKGHDDLLDALGKELVRHPGLKLLWVGDGWWRQRLVERARGLGLIVAELDRLPPGARAPTDTHVLLTGLVLPQRVPALMHAMDILAHPSRREGLPRTVPQALLTGVVPVAYDVDGTNEACIDGPATWVSDPGNAPRPTGRLVTPGSVKELRHAVMSLVDAPAERARLADAGRTLCQTRFAAETMVAELQRVYQHALTLARTP